MSIGGGIALFVIGAILAFAVNVDVVLARIVRSEQARSRCSKTRRLTGRSS